MEAMTFTRAPDEEAYLVYVCLPTMGVVSSLKLAYIHQLVTGFLAARPSNSIAVIIHANRASDSKRFLGLQEYSNFIQFSPRNNFGYLIFKVMNYFGHNHLTKLISLRRKEKDEPDSDSGHADSDSENGDEKDEEQNLLMNFRHKFEATLREPSRMLLVKDLLVTFDPSTVYGQRMGFLKGLLVTVAQLIRKNR